MSEKKTWPWITLGIVTFILGFSVGYFPFSVPDERDSGSRRDTRPPVARATELFQKQCALCHGPEGRGDGFASPMLLPPPRDFGDGDFRLTSTDNGVPCREDLIRVLERGIPGSAMPSFSWLGDRDLALLSDHVLDLAIAGKVSDLRSRTSRDRLPEREIHAQAIDAMRPGKVLQSLDAIPTDPASIEHGKELYLQRCSLCHGDDGKGVAHASAWDERDDFNVNWSRDFTAGILKGGGRPRDLAWRILSGMKGTAMLRSSFEDPGDLGALVAYVSSLLPEEDPDRLVHRRRDIRAKKVDTLPTLPNDTMWETVASSSIVFSPLWWHDDAVLHGSVKAVHDESSLALLVAWDDATRDDAIQRPDSLADGVAVQFSTDPQPALFGMGSHDHGVNIWHWKAFRHEEIQGLFDLIESPPHRPIEPSSPVADVSYHPVPGLGSRSEQAQSNVAKGPGDIAESLRSVGVKSSWIDGRWAVLFTRDLDPIQDSELDLREGLQISFAIWNGGAGQDKSRKSISIWHELSLGTPNEARASQNQ